MDILLGVLILWSIGAVLAGILANGKCRNVAGWVLGSVFITPLIILILLALPPLEDQRSLYQYKKESFKTCPFCAEDVKKQAIVCPFCQRNI